MTNADRQLLGAGLLGLAGIAGASAPALVRLPLGLPLALFLPGYAWLRMTAPEEPQSSERLTLAAGLSLALCVLAGFALNAVGRLDPQGWAAALGGLTILCCVMAALRQRAPRQTALGRSTLRFSPSQAAMFALALGVAAFGVRYAAVALEGHREFKFTQFWMTPRSDADRSLVTIGIRNEEERPMTYAVTLVSEGSELSNWPPVNVAPGKTWTTDLAISGELRNHRLEAWLRRADAPAEIYRKVWIAPVATQAER